MVVTVRLQRHQTAAALIAAQATVEAATVVVEAAIERVQNHRDNRLAIAGLPFAALWLHQTPHCCRQA
jgi:hypothetical protein